MWGHLLKKPTEADVQALYASWAWRIVGPVYKVEREIQRWQRRRREGRPPKADALQLALQDVAVDFDALKASYLESPLAAEPDNFVLYRILGNDLEPRHRKGQTRSNLGLILAHEPQLDDCEKRWIVNRIFDPDEEALIIDMLERSGQPYTRIPFDIEEYGKVGWETDGFGEAGFFLSEAFERLDPDQRERAEVHARRRKNRYAMNNNGARNTALEEGRSVAKWILPLDGNCFMTPRAWAALRQAVQEQAYLPYFVVPMLRVPSNEVLLEEEVELPPEDEPQLMFRRDAAQVFNEAHPYGVRPKVELLWRLGVPGVWGAWEHDPWDLPAPELSSEASQFAVAGWVGRLESGRPELERGEQSEVLRYASRSAGIIHALDALDSRAILGRYDPSSLALYDEDRLAQLAEGSPEDLRDTLKSAADAALSRGPYSVTNKRSVAPSGNPHDYFSVGRYWWPDPTMPDGLPYLWREGEDVLAAGLPDFAPEQFDGQRWQSLVDETTALALAGTVCRDGRYLAHAARLVRNWFLDPETRMTPHLRFAEVARGHDRDENHCSGVINLAGLYYFLDAVRLIERSGALDPDEQAAFRNWLRAYLDWLHESPQGRRECRAQTSHGTFFDLQVLAIAAFLGDGAEMAKVLRRARERIPHQFAADGSQPRELARIRPLHNSRHNLLAWTALARIAESLGDDFLVYRTADGRGIEMGLRWLEGQGDGSMEAPGASEPGVAPFAPLWSAGRIRFPDSGPQQAVGIEPATLHLDPFGAGPIYGSLLR